LDAPSEKVESMEIKGTFKASFQEGDLYKEKLKPKKGLKPLLKPVSLISPPKLDYLGTSFGLTLHLFNFWMKNGYSPVYIRQTRNDVTGEHSCIMILPFNSSDIQFNLDTSP